MGSCEDVRLVCSSEIRTKEDNHNDNNNVNKKNKWCKIVKACIWCSREEEGILKKEENNAAVPIHWSKSMYRIGYFSLIH